MLVEIIETFKKLSDGSLLHPGDVIDIPQEKANRLIEKGRARLLPETREEIPSCKTCNSFNPDRERGHLGLGYCGTHDHYIWTDDSCLCLDFSQENAPSCHEEGLRGAPLPPKEEMPLPARFQAGDRVRFAHRRALDILEGIVLEAKWHPAPVSRWWYRVETTDGKFWVGESHIQGGVHAKCD